MKKRINYLSSTSVHRKAISFSKAVFLGARTSLRWNKVSELLQTKFDIPSQAPASSYRKFMSTFPETRVDKYRVNFSHAASESLVMLAFSGWLPRKLIRVFGKKIPLPGLKSPVNVFKVRFVLTSSIEPHMNHPFRRDLPAPVCAVTSIQGPGKKYVNPEKLVADLNEQLHEPWQNYLLGEIVAHAKSQGLDAVSLLRPEYNPNLSNTYLESRGLTSVEIQKMRSQFYAAAKANNLHKIKGSKYFWVFFNKSSA
ncbi:MAG: hypothetical protein WC462_01270 [archaeon]